MYNYLKVCVRYTYAVVNIFYLHKLCKFAEIAMSNMRESLVKHFYSLYYYFRLSFNFIRNNLDLYHIRLCRPIYIEIKLKRRLSKIMQYKFTSSDNVKISRDRHAFFA